MLKFLDGNNRIVALVLVIVVGLVKAFFGIDLQHYVDIALTLIHVDGSWLNEFGVQATPAQVAFYAYSFFSIVRALVKRARGLTEKGVPVPV